MLASTIEKGRVKKILKAHSSSSCVASAVSDDTSAEYSKIMSRLTSFKKESRKATKTNNMKMQWYAEQTSLSQSLSRCEDELSKIVQQMILGSISAIEAGVHEAIEESARLLSTRTSTQQNFWEQFQELKSMLQHISRKGDLGSTDCLERTVSADVSIVTSDNYSAARSIFAELLVSSLSAHSQQWQELIDTEKSLYEELRSMSVSISSNLQSDRLTEQNRKLREDMDLSETEEYEIELLVYDWMRKLERVDKEYSDSINLISIEHQHKCVVSLGVDPHSKNGGWPDHEHEIFVKIYRRAQQVGSRKDLHEQLSSALSGRCAEPESISIHEQWYRSLRASATKRKSLTETYTSNRSEIIAQAQSAIYEARENMKERREKDTRLQEHEEHRLKVHKKLLDLQRKRDLMLMEEKAKADLEAALKEEELRALKIQALEEAEKKRNQVKEYQRAKAEERAKIMEKERQLQEEYIRMVNMEVERNRSKVERRRIILHEKEEERRNRERAFFEKEEKRRELISKIAEQCPYWDSVQNAVSKLDHLTAASKGHEYIKGPDPGRGFLPVNGFTSRKIMSDAKFRIAVALREAGVAHSSAARDLVQKLHVRPNAPF